MSAAAQGQWDRLIVKREHARRQFFIGLNRRQTRRWRKWERVMDKTSRCEMCGLFGLGGGVDCRLPDTLPDQPRDACLCWEHAHQAGFCAYCGELHSGEWDFDFNGDRLCDGCRDELRDCSPAGTFPGPRDLLVITFSRP